MQTSLTERQALDAAIDAVSPDHRLQSAASNYLAARLARGEAAMALAEAEALHVQAEAALIDAIDDHPSEDGGAVVCEGRVLVLAEEYWDLQRGQRVQVHLLFSATDATASAA